ncbi:MAG: PASTA domain-containing protein [Vicinamibacteria bacterium]|jgi:serine/threonine-protein kinase|nr:PASTA domain-containing protein [Vicinamibacteria bacterium]
MIVIKRLLLFTTRNALLVVALLATMAVSSLITMRVILKSQDVMTPDITRLPLKEAQDVLAHYRLSMRVASKRIDAQAAQDHVISQDPPAGARLKAHRTVKVVISLGPPKRVVPPVEGMGQRTARLVLDQAGFQIARVVEVDSRLAEGTVLRQRPGSDAPTTQKDVSLLVSRGPRSFDYLMPDMIGQPIDKILDDLQRAGLKVGDIRYRAYPGVAPGIVLRHEPPAGHRVSNRIPITLDVSKE